jgi:hypothetical protein
MTVTTSRWTSSAGVVPAEMALARAGSASCRKKALAICERPALWRQAKTTRSIDVLRTFRFDTRSARILQFED